MMRDIPNQPDASHDYHPNQTPRRPLLRGRPLLCYAARVGRGAAGQRLRRRRFCAGRRPPLCHFGTSYGDGEYPCSTGAKIGVDSGTVGCIRIADISDPEVQDEAELNRLGTVVVFCDEFGCGSDSGVLFFGGVTVDTAGEDEDGDDGDYYEEEDQDEDEDY